MKKINKALVGCFPLLSIASCIFNTPSHKQPICDNSLISVDDHNGQGVILFKNQYFDCASTGDSISTNITTPIQWRYHEIQSSNVVPYTDHLFSFTNCVFDDTSKNSKIVFTVNGNSSSDLETYFEKDENNPSYISDAYDKSSKSATPLFEANNPFSLTYLNNQNELSNFNLGFVFHVVNQGNISSKTEEDIVVYADLSKSTTSYDSSKHLIQLNGSVVFDKYCRYELSYSLSLDITGIQLKYHETTGGKPPYFELQFDKERNSLFKGCNLNICDITSKPYANGSFDIGMDCVVSHDWLSSADVPAISSIYFDSFETGDYHYGFEFQYKKSDSKDIMCLNTKNSTTTDSDLVIPLSNIHIQQANGEYLNNDEKEALLSTTRSSHLSFEYSDFDAPSMDKYNVKGYWYQITSKKTNINKPGGWTYIEYPFVYETINKISQQDEYSKILEEEKSVFNDGNKLDFPYSEIVCEKDSSSKCIGLRIKNLYWKYGSMFEKLDGVTEKDYFEDKIHHYTIQPYFNWAGRSLQPIKLKGIDFTITKQWKNSW